MVNSIRELEVLISRLLTFGVFLSIFFVSIGVGLYLMQTGGLTLALGDEWFLKGETVFDVLSNIIGKLFSWSDLSFVFMSMGILLLMLTQYIRVIMSVIYFIFIKDWKYVAITLAVSIILTLSLLNILRAG
ncbi:MAG: DUF1634 domain-containing protein [archaeon GB-1867-035]|nr:DUF1634 domain-containing protein [Candidatus Culexmicrobium profundum]